MSPERENPRPPPRQTVPVLLVMLSGGSFLQLPVQLAGTGGRQAHSEPLQSVTASHCKSSNAKVLFGAVKPHGFSLSTL